MSSDASCLFSAHIASGELRFSQEGIASARSWPTALQAMVRSLPTATSSALSLPHPDDEQATRRPRSHRFRSSQPHKSTSIMPPWNDTLGSHVTASLCPTSLPARHSLSVLLADGPDQLSLHPGLKRNL